MFKSKKAEAVAWSLVAIVGVVAVVAIVFMATGKSAGITTITGAATSINCLEFAQEVDKINQQLISVGERYETGDINIPNPCTGLRETGIYEEAVLVWIINRYVLDDGSITGNSLVFTYIICSDGRASVTNRISNKLICSTL
jgi:hypothetical protein